MMDELQKRLRDKALDDIINSGGMSGPMVAEVSPEQAQAFTMGMERQSPKRPIPKLDNPGEGDKVQDFLRKVKKSLTT